MRNRHSEGEHRAREPLPFRRMLTEQESRELWEKLREHWGVEEHYWHPLALAEMPPNVLALQAAWFHQAVPPDRLRQLLASRGIARVWELREDGSTREIDLELLEPYYDTGLEGYWTSEALDWLVYASHESSITVAGEWLIEAVKEVWPDWHLRIYSGWDYEPPREG